jgi:hypothetical protein
MNVRPGGRDYHKRIVMLEVVKPDRGAIVWWKNLAWASQRRRRQQQKAVRTVTQRRQDHCNDVRQSAEYNQRLRAENLRRSRSANVRRAGPSVISRKISDGRYFVVLRKDSTVKSTVG